jgi:hypothetical protein
MFFRGTPTHGHGVPNLYLLHYLVTCMQVAALAIYSLSLSLSPNLIVMHALLIDRPRPAGE